MCKSSCSVFCCSISSSLCECSQKFHYVHWLFFANGLFICMLPKIWQFFSDVFMMILAKNGYLTLFFSQESPLFFIVVASLEIMPKQLRLLSNNMNIFFYNNKRSNRHPTEILKARSSSTWVGMRNFCCSWPVFKLAIFL